MYLTMGILPSKWPYVNLILLISKAGTAVVSLKIDKEIN